jgi:hypothetical protein
MELWNKQESDAERKVVPLATPMLGNMFNCNLKL